MKYLLLFILCVFPTFSYSGESLSRIKSIQINALGNIQDIAVVKMISGIQNSPSCGHGDKRYVVDLTSAGGRAIYGALLTVYSQGKEVKIVGVGACPRVSYLESISYVMLL